MSEVQRLFLRLGIEEQKLFFRLGIIYYICQCSIFFLKCLTKKQPYAKTVFKFRKDRVNGVIFA